GNTPECFNERLFGQPGSDGNISVGSALLASQPPERRLEDFRQGPCFLNGESGTGGSIGRPSKEVQDISYRPPYRLTGGAPSGGILCSAGQRRTPGHAAERRHGITLYWSADPPRAARRRWMASPRAVPSWANGATPSAAMLGKILWSCCAD